MTQYTSGGGGLLRYICQQTSINYGEKLCISLQGAQLGDFIQDKILNAVQPSSLQVSLKVVENLCHQRELLIKHWELRLERAKYEVDRTFRQYNSAEPENRLVARALEKNWEEALSSEEKLKQEYHQFVSQQPPVMTAEEREMICSLAGDFPTIWKAITTTNQQRQQIVRLLIEKIVIDIVGDTEKVNLEIHWAGGHITNEQYIRPVRSALQLSYYQDLINHIKTHLAWIDQNRIRKVESYQVEKV